MTRDCRALLAMTRLATALGSSLNIQHFGIVSPYVYQLASQALRSHHPDVIGHLCIITAETTIIKTF